MHKPASPPKLETEGAAGLTKTRKEHSHTNTKLQTHASTPAKTLPKNC